MRNFAVAVIFSIIASITFNIPAHAEQGEFFQIKTNHFIINYRADVSKDFVFQIKNEAERFYRIITQEFNFVRDESWLWDKRAKIFIAKDKDDYAQSFDCSAWSGACVNYRDKIIYTYPNQERFSSLFAHELTHIIFREYVGEGELPLWLDEGIATYMENKYGDKRYQNAYQYLKNQISTNNYIKFSKLENITPRGLASESKEYVTLFYVESFSIVDFAMRKYGKYKFSRFLDSLRKGYSLKSSLPKLTYDLKDLSVLEERWKGYYLR